MTMRVVKCELCGYRFKADPEKRYQQGQVSLVKGKIKSAPAKKKYTVDLTCPNCKQDFEVKVEV